MLKNTSYSVLLLAGLAAFGLFFISSSGGRAGAANTGNTGAPGEPTTQTCGSCHSGGVFAPVSGLVSLTLPGETDPIDRYQPGQTYELTYRVQASGNPLGYGLQMTSLDGGNQEAGTWSSPASNVQIETASAVGGRTYIEHKGVTSNNIFTLNWTAPTDNVGLISFYHAASAVNRNGSSGGDNGSGSQLFILEPEGGATGLDNQLQEPQITLFPNPLVGNQLFVQGSWITEELPTVRVYDASGKLVWIQENFDGTQTLELPSMLPGLAVLELVGKQTQISRTFLKQ